MKEAKKQEVILHGECMVFPSSLPKMAKAKTVSGSFLIVADSETTGNHHVVDINDGVSFYEDEERLFMVNEKPTKIRCVQASRHSDVTLEPNIWEFGFQQEYDYFTERMQQVRD